MMSLILAQAQEIQLDDLDNGPGILPFALGATKIVSHHHTFLQDINLKQIENQIYNLRTQLAETTIILSNYSFPSFNLQIKHLYNKLNRMLLELETMQPNRVKRGIFNPLGTLIKSICGNLDQNDALRFESAMKTLKENDKMISSKLNEHISLFKEFTSQQTQILNNLTMNQDKLLKAIIQVTNMTNAENEKAFRYAHLAQLLVILSDNIQELASEISRLENILAFSRNRSLHHSILSVRELRTMISKLQNLYSTDQIIDLDIRYYYDIISLGSYYVDKKIVVVLKFPITLPNTFQLYRLCPVPNKDSKVILPAYPYVATNSKEYVYIEAECPKVHEWHLCEQKTSHGIRSGTDCIIKLIQYQEIDETCPGTPISLTKEALLELDSRHYIVSFPKPTRVQLFCGHENHKVLQGSFLATIPKSCKMKSSEFTLANIDDKVNGFSIEITAFPRMTNYSQKGDQNYHLASIDLSTLNNIQKQITMESSVETDSGDSSSIYHTTIPLYLLVIGLLSAGALISRNFIRRMQALTVKSKKDVIELSEQDKRAATFALDISK